MSLISDIKLQSIAIIQSKRKVFHVGPVIRNIINKYASSWIEYFRTIAQETLQRVEFQK